MPIQWNQLADAFVARGRLEALAILEELDASERREFLGPGEVAEPSPGLLAAYFSCGAGDFVAYASLPTGSLGGSPTPHPLPVPTSPPSSTACGGS